jgi:hypothetical protein
MMLHLLRIKSRPSKAQWLPICFAQSRSHAFKLEENFEAASDGCAASMPAQGTVVRQVHELLTLETEQYRNGS